MEALKKQAKEPAPPGLAGVGRHLLVEKVRPHHCPLPSPPPHSATPTPPLAARAR